MSNDGNNAVQMALKFSGMQRSDLDDPAVLKYLQLALANSIGFNLKPANIVISRVFDTIRKLWQRTMLEASYFIVVDGEAKISNSMRPCLASAFAIELLNRKRMLDSQTLD